MMKIIFALSLFFASSMATTCAYDLQWGTLGTNPGEFGAGFLLSIENLALDPAGNVFVCDRGNNRIQKFDPDGVFIAELTVGPCYGVTWYNNNILTTQTAQDRVYQFTDDLAGAGPLTYGADVQTPNGVPRTCPTCLDLPAGTAFDSNGDVFITDYNNDRIQKFTGDLQTHLLGFTRVGMDRPFGIFIDDSDNIYITESNPSDTLTKFSPDGASILWSHDSTSTPPIDDPRQVTLDDSGVVYVTNTNDHSIHLYDAATGGYMYSIGGPNPSSVDGEFDGPKGVAVGTNGYFYVGDSDNERIQRFNCPFVVPGPGGSE